MTKYFCPECGYEGDEPICPHCSIPAESLDYDEEKASKDDSYSPDDIEDAGVSKDEIVKNPEDQEF